MRELLAYSFVIPPTIFIVTGLAGALMGLRHPGIGTKIALVSSIFLYVLATPAATRFLLHQLVSSVPTDIDWSTAQAIVVFSADIRLRGPSGESETVGLLTLDRLAAAAQLYRRLHLPIVVSGGQVPGAEVSSASMMRDELKQNFLVPVALLEEKSHTTYENAAYTSQILTSSGYNSVIVVLQKRDIPRALWSFSRFGIHAIPYSTDQLPDKLEIGDFFPSPYMSLESYYAIHEIIGLIYYKLIY